MSFPLPCEKGRVYFPALSGDDLSVQELIQGRSHKKRAHRKRAKKSRKRRCGILIEPITGRKKVLREKVSFPTLAKPCPHYMLLLRKRKKRRSAGFSGEGKGYALGKARHLEEAARNI